MDFEEIEAMNDCAGEGQQQFNRPRDREEKTFPITIQTYATLAIRTFDKGEAYS
jgi:hypothetical protein